MRTESNLTGLVEELQANCGDFYAACRSMALSPAFVRKWQKDDPQVSEAIQNATEVGALQLESAAVQRAVRGVEKDVYYKGDVVGTEVVYSDGLLITLLKGRLKGTYGGENAGANINVNLSNAINLMPRATTYEEWLTFAGQTTALKALENNKVAEAEYTAVLPPAESDPAMADIL